MIQSYMIPSHMIQSHMIQSYMIQSYMIQSYTIHAYMIQSHMIQSFVIQSHMIQSHMIQSHMIQSYVIQANRIHTYRLQACMQRAHESLCCRGAAGQKPGLRASKRYPQKGGRGRRRFRVKYAPPAVFCCHANAGTPPGDFPKAPHVCSCGPVPVPMPVPVPTTVHVPVSMRAPVPVSVRPVFSVSRVPPPRHPQDIYHLPSPAQERACGLVFFECSCSEDPLCSVPSPLCSQRIRIMHGPPGVVLVCDPPPPRRF